MRTYQTAFINPATLKRTYSYRGSLDDARASIARTFEAFARQARDPRPLWAWLEGLVALCGYGGEGKRFEWIGPDNYTYIIEEDS